MYPINNGNSFLFLSHKHTHRLTRNRIHVHTKSTENIYLHKIHLLHWYCIACKWNTLDYRKDQDYISIQWWGHYRGSSVKFHWVQIFVLLHSEPLLTALLSPEWSMMWQCDNDPCVPCSGDSLVSVSRAERLEDVTECQPICYVQQNEGAGEQDPWHSVLKPNIICK